MIYKIMKNTTTSNNGAMYWQFILNTDNTEYSTDNLDTLEIRLKELLREIPISKLKVVTEVSFTDDLIFNTNENSSESEMV